MDRPCIAVKALVRQLDPRVTMLDTTCTSVAEGEELLDAASRWCRGPHRGRRER
jgi:hypothetical protein